MKILITGGLGFIGHTLVRRLVGDGAQVRILDNLSNAAVNPESLLTLGCDFIEGDIRNRELCDAVAAGMDGIVHLAGQTNVLHSIEHPMEDMEINVRGTLNLLEAARRCRVNRFVFASSNGVVGEREPPMHEKMLPIPLSPYGCTKLMGEYYSRAYHALYGLQSVSLRFANVYGPGSVRKGSVVAKYLKHVINGEELIVFGDGEQTRDFVYIDDLVDGIVRALRVEQGGAVFCLGSGVETSVNRLVALLRAEVEPDIGRRLTVVHQPARNGEIIRNYSDISLARKVLGFAPSVTVKEGVCATWRWFKNAGRT
ncbi:MAG: NAD-dependent epimerase/dehydratase family protein [Magnetococcales bacterium]|nr:NAD-dependent epimerase/dehydratase family protein [Magnetococcales bacterium]MBF0148992.1 NAD-dependent epimerase/dehydratase family protein [Magnetococcales bacterium]MBF0603058.1 NAD-dependent epimerase/dehydratase family protein [Magnetococcales bacterium]